MSILDEARALVEGPRRDHYGHPSENHGCTAELVRAYIKRSYGVDVPIDGHDICMFNILQKVSREACGRQRDNRVDIAGYALNADVIATDERGSVLISEAAA